MNLNKLKAAAPCNTFHDVFRLTGRLMRIDEGGHPYLRLRLSNVDTDVIAIAEPEQLSLEEPIPYLGLVSASGVIRHLDGETVCEVTHVETVSDCVFWDLPALYTCPRLYCPKPDSLDLLVRTVRSLQCPALVHFVRLILEQTDRLQKFITLPASHRYHHSFKGGLLVGSTPFLRTVLKRLITSDPERQLYVASWDYGTVQHNRIYQLALRFEYGIAGGELAPV